MKTTASVKLTAVEQGRYTYTARSGERFVISKVRDRGNGYTWVATGDRGTYLDELKLQGVRIRLMGL